MQETIVSGLRPELCYDEYMKRWKKVFITIITAAYLSAGLVPVVVFADAASDKIAQQQQLQQQLQDLQNQIDGLQKQLSQTTAQKNTLANKIKQLKNQQAVLNLQIQATNLQVNQLGQQISETQKAIAQNSDRAGQLRSQMASIIRAINSNDDRPLLYTIVSKQKLSEVYTAYQDYANITNSLSKVVGQLRDANEQFSQFEAQLSDQQQDAEDLLNIKVLQQAELTGKVGEQNNLLQQTKGREADYQATLNDTKQRAAQISSQIYELLGISGQITFGEALKVAQWASGLTGVTPAFLLAVLTQESNLGKNVGTCNRLNDPPSKSYKAVMKPDRDIQPFLDITASLGMDPNITPVSCAAKDKNGNQLGWGGAMGPAQFIPSTWMGYKDKVAQVTGKAIANPWDIRDAFAAAAIKLKAGGADGTYQGNWNAAMRYFSGSTNVKYRFYGDSVMSLTEKYQNDINTLAN